MATDPDTLAAAQKKFVLARVNVTALWPYLGFGVSRLVPRWDEAVPTMGVDAHWRLYLNPTYVAGLHPATFALLLAGHELQHVLGNHANRLTAYREHRLVINGTPHDLANVCHDLAINSMLEEFARSGAEYRRQAGLQPISNKPKPAVNDPAPITVPADGLYPPMFKDRAGKPFPSGLLGEDYVKLFDKNCDTVTLPKCGRCGPCGSGGGSSPQPWEDGGEPDPRRDAETGESSGVSAAEAETIRRQTAHAAREQAAKMRGTVPGSLVRWAEFYFEPPKNPWQRLLRKAVRTGVNRLSGVAEYTYTVRNKRSPPKLILPSFYRPQPRVAVCLDTSGSMGKKDFQNGVAEIFGVIRAHLSAVPVVCYDAGVQSVQLVRKPGDIKFKGGGGTDMGEAIRVTAKLTKARLIVCVTDGITPYNGDPPRGAKVIVCLTQPPSKSWSI
jgi:predicted metal-dependent peptidase